MKGQGDMSSKLDTIIRIIRLGYNNFWRNRWLTIGATLLMTLTLTMISVSLLISFMIKDTADLVRSSINLAVYFRDDAVPDQKIHELENRIRALPDVTNVIFVSKSEALGIFNRSSANKETKDFVGEEFNPFPRSIEIETSNAEKLDQIVAGITQADSEKIVCSDCVSHTKTKEIVDKLISGTKTAQQAGWLLSIFFGVIAIFNVYNIIRLTISARSDEIEIMRYVGASNSFTRGPFIIEGILYGLLGTLATTILLPLLAYIITRYRGDTGISGVGSAFGILNVNLFTYINQHLVTLVLIQLAIGVVIGVLVSWLSVRRYLRA